MTKLPSGATAGSSMLMTPGGVGITSRTGVALELD